MRNDGAGRRGPNGGRPLPPLVRALDLNTDGIIDAIEWSKASSSLIILDRNNDGKLTEEELRPSRGPGGDRPNPGGPSRVLEGLAGRPRLPIMEALDLNHDGILDADEIAKAPISLKTLDKNEDGSLSFDELLPPRPNGRTGGPDDPPPANRQALGNRRPASDLANSPKDHNLPAIYRQFTNVVEVYRDGDYAIIHTKDLPNHPSPYYDRSNPLYARYDGTNPNFRINPNRIEEQDLVFRIPLRPEKASNHHTTPMGPFGVAVNGVVIFNQFAAGRKTLTFERNSFDQYNGHPAPTGEYHYHIEPLYLSKTAGRDALVGVLLDGFLVYGPEENGKTITNHDLDDFHGHSGPTRDYPEGIYHYHVTAEVPYINGGQFYGNPGDVSR